MSTTPITTIDELRLNGQRLDGLIAAMAGGDREAFAALYDAARASVYGFALAILRDRHDAEDVTQETFVRAFLASGQYRPEGKPMAWLLTIAKYLACEKHREAGRVTVLPDAARDRAEESLSPEERLVLQGAMADLTEEERQIVILHAVAGFRHRETAELLDLALPTVLSKYHRALKKLRRHWKECD